MKQVGRRMGGNGSGQRNRKHSRARRRLLAESLESRQLLAGDVLAFHNHLIAADVNVDMKVTPIDALQVINHLNRNGAGALNAEAELSGESTTSRKALLDVNGDNQVSPIDALQVINVLNRGEGEQEKFVRLLLDITDENGDTLLSAGSRETTVNVGDRFDLQLEYLDLRTGADRAGVFSLYADILADNTDKFLPFVGSTVVLELTSDISGGSFQLTGNGNTATVNVSGISANSIDRAFEQELGFGPGSVRVQSETDSASGSRSFFVTFTSDEFALKATPQLSLNATGITTFSGNPGSQAMSLDTSTYSVLVNDNGNGVVDTPSEFGASALEFGINRITTAFFYTDFDGNRVPLPRTYFGAAPGGAYNPNGQEVFDEVGGLFQGTQEVPDFAESIAVDVDNDGQPDFFGEVDLGMPFDAFRIPLIAIAPTAPADPVSFQVDTSDEDGQEVLLFGLQYNQEPFNQLNPNELVEIQTTEGGSGRANVHIVEVPQLRAIADTAATPVNNPVTIPVLGNDTNPDPDTPVVDAITNAAANGSVQINTSGSVTYTPAANFAGTDTFTYRIRNAAGATATAQVTVTVTNSPPVAVNDTLEVEEDTPRTFTSQKLFDALLANDSAGPANEQQTLELVSGDLTGSAGGTLEENADGTFTYTPPKNVFGPASETFTYQITDGIDTATGTVTVNIAGVNDAPVAVDDLEETVDEGSSGQLLSVLDNDSPGPNESDTLTVTAVTQPATGGSVAISENGNGVVFTPTTNFVGQTSFTYTVSDGELTSTATVSVDVVPTVRPRAVNDSLSVSEGGTLTINVASDLLANDLPNPGFTAELSEVIGLSGSGVGTLVNNGDGTLTYTPPNDDFNTVADNGGQPVTFTYRVTDDSELPSTDPAAAVGTVSISVTPVNDMPVAVADDLTGNPVDEDTPRVIGQATLTGNDSSGAANEQSQARTVASVSAQSAQGGTVVLSNGQITYTPPQDYFGPDSFTYTVSDGELTSASATVSLQVRSINDPPVTASVAKSVDEGGVLSFPAADLRANDSPGPGNESGQTLTVVSVSGQSAQGGTVSFSGGQVTYTPPNSDFFGSDEFTYRVSDGQSVNAEATGTVTVTVRGVNDPPVAASDQLVAFRDAQATYEASALLSNDSAGPANENQTLTLVSVRATGETRGTVALVSGRVVYTPPAGQSDITDRFEYVISDGVEQTVGVANVRVENFIPSRITGSVFFDVDGDSAQTGAEAGLGSARVRLVGQSATGPVDRVSLTLDDGSFAFESLSPGSYRVVFETPSGIVDGPDVVGSAGDGDTVENQFSVEVTGIGGVHADGYGFSVTGLEANRGELLDLLVSTYVLANPDLASDPQAVSGGVSVGLSADGALEWFRSHPGFGDIKFGELALNQDRSRAMLTIVTENGEVRTAELESERFLVIDDGQNGMTVRVFGGLSAHDFITINPSTAARPAEFDDYLDAVDHLFAQENDAF